MAIYSSWSLFICRLWELFTVVLCYCWRPKFTKLMLRNTLCLSFALNIVVTLTMYNYGVFILKINKASYVPCYSSVSPHRCISLSIHYRPTCSAIDIFVITFNCMGIVVDISSKLIIKLFKRMYFSSNRGRLFRDVL